MKRADAKLTFVGPDGAQVADADPADVARLMLERGGDYWNSGSGDAGLVFTRDAYETKLQLVFDLQCGFHLLFVASDKARFIAVGDGSEDRIVAPFVGGDPKPLPEAYFVSREAAAAAMNEFAHTGQRPTNVRWISSEDAVWSRDPTWYERYHG